VGGLSVTREIIPRLPACPLIYLADQAHAPYGQRSLSEIQDFTGEIARLLLAQGAEVIVVACNTASAAALRWLRQQFPAVPFVGMEPAVKPAAERTRTGHIGVIATAATFQGELFASLLDRFAIGVTVHTQVCPELVPLVEAGELDTPRTRAAVTGYLAPLQAAGIDQLVLGCTHYPFLRPLIEETLGPGVEVIDPAPAVARQTAAVAAQLSGGQPAPAPPGGPGVQGLPRPIQPAHRFFTTGDARRFQTALRQLLGLRAMARRARWLADGSLRPDTR
jgi:glutamate racemase